ncbi:MAG: hypothetical protein HY265_04995 [Deltaproteobacteria bacterium]|nr:hypothetical protein [Deltaproteobacteria bacterium]
MPATIKKIEKPVYSHPDKTEILKKLNRSTLIITNSTILPILKKRGAVELTLTELRKRLSRLKTPLSQEIIAERKTV